METTMTTEPEKTVKYHRTPMIVKDVELTARNGDLYNLHYRVLGKKRDHFSGFLVKKHAGWKMNCAISIPIVYGKEEFQKVVDSVLDNSSKFTASNTVGRPRYFDILQNGMNGVKAENMVQQLRANNPDFHICPRSKRAWYYKSVGGNFNMRSVKINHVHFSSTVAFRELLPYIKDEATLKLLDNLKHKQFEFEKEFIDFANEFMDSTEDTFVNAYNGYMGSLMGTATHRPVKTKAGTKEHWTIYIADRSACSDEDTYWDIYNKAMAHVPFGTPDRDITTVRVELMEPRPLAEASVAKKRAEMVAKLTAAIERKKKRATKV